MSSFKYRMSDEQFCQYLSDMSDNADTTTHPIDLTDDPNLADDLPAMCDKVDELASNIDQLHREMEVFHTNICEHMDRFKSKMAEMYATWSYIRMKLDEAVARHEAPQLNL